MRTKKEMLEDYDIRENGDIYLNGKKLKTHINKNGFRMVAGVGVHTLVAEKYVHKPKGSVTVKHKDGNKK